MKQMIFCAWLIKTTGPNSMSRILRQAGATATYALILLALCIPLLACAQTSGTRQDTENGLAERNQVSQMTDYAKTGRYDDAIQLGLGLLKDNPRDEVIYQQLADVYLLRARKESDRRDESVAKAISCIQKSLSLHADDKDPAGVHIFQDARTFEAAGDLTLDNRCDYYAKAKELLERRSSSLQGDNVTLAGKTFPLEPLRRENQKVLTGVIGKIELAKCDSKANNEGGGTR